MIVERVVISERRGRSKQGDLAAMDERSGLANQTAETQAIDRKSMFGELLQIDGSLDKKIQKPV